MSQVLGPYDTKLNSKEESQFQTWKSKYAPNDSGFDYDLRGAFKANLTPDPETGHWPDTYKKPNHPTFSNESQYATGENAKLAGHWAGPEHNQFIFPMSQNNDIINQVIKTNPQGNWGVPLNNAQISPRSGILSRLQDMIYGTEAGRRGMGALDVAGEIATKFSGGPEGMLGNVIPGGEGMVSHAITPFLENMTKEGIIKKAANLFGEDRALFMDRMGDVYDLGHMYGPKSLVHEEALSNAGKMPLAYSEGKPIGLDLPKALENEQLMRIRKGGRITQLEMTQSPSNAQYEQLMALAEQSPKMEWGAQLHNMKFPRDYMNPTFLDNPNAYTGVHTGTFDNLINTIYKFFGK